MAFIRLTTDFSDPQFLDRQVPFEKNGETLLIQKPGKLSLLRLMSRQIMQFQEFELASGFTFAQHLEEIYPRISADAQTFPLTKVVLTPREFALLPASIKDEKIVDGLLSASLLSNSGHQIKVQQPILYNSIYMHFNVDADILKPMPYSYKVDYLSLYGFLLEFWSSIHKENNDKNIFIHVEKNEFYFSYFLDGQLQHFNIFEFKVAADFLYFVLFACKELDIDAKNATIYLHGIINDQSELYKILRIYIKELRFLEIQSSRFGGFNPDPSHLFTDLFATIACVS